MARTYGSRRPDGGRGDGRHPQRHPQHHPQRRPSPLALAAAEPAPRRRRARRSALRPLAWLTALALLAGGGWWALSQAPGLIPGRSSAGGAEGRADGGAQGCGQQRTIRVVVAPELEETVRESLDEVSAGCGRYTVEALAPAQAAAQIRDGQAPDVWVPDSTSWIDLAEGEDGRGRWAEGRSLASSPVVLAVGEGRKEPTFGSWTDLMTSAAPIRLANPEADSASRLVNQVSGTSRSDTVDLDNGARLMVLSRFAAASTNQMLDDYGKDPAGTNPFPVSERALTRWNSEHPDAPRLRALTPTEGTVSLDYPWLTRPDLEPDVRAATDQAREALSTPEARSALAAAGLRTEGSPAPEGGAADDVAEIALPDRRVRDRAAQQWEVLRTDLRLLPVVDVSGSMAYPASATGDPRYALTQAFLLRGLELLPAGSQVGLWVFSSDLRPGGIDYRELVPVRRLDAEARGGTQREVIRDQVRRIDRYISDDTGLYDSVWAAYQQMQSQYDPDYVNTIAVITDGENDDPSGGLSLEQLLARIEGSKDPDRPVSIITIGTGEASPTALRAISDATGGTSKVAKDPSEIETVLVGALLDRGE